LCPGRVVVAARRRRWPDIYLLVLPSEDLVAPVGRQAAGGIDPVGPQGALGRRREGDPMNRRIVVAALAALALGTFGTAHAQTNRLIIGSASEVSSFSPVGAVDVYSAKRINVIMEPLVVFDRGLGLEPRLATTWSFSDDGLTLSFELRQGVRFHHGREFTSDDVRFTFETILDPEFAAVNRPLYIAIESIDTPDPYTVVFNLNTPTAFLINNIARLPIMPADAAEDFGQRPVGTGPYQFESHVRDDRLVLRRFDDYWGGAGSIEYLEYRVIPENSTRLLAFEAGEIDVTQSQVPPDELPRLEADPNFILERTPGTGYTYLGFNTIAEPLDDVHVRQALNHLIPREAIVERVLNGNGFPGISMLLPTMPWFNPDVRIYDYDPELARSLLADAGAEFTEPLRLYTHDNAVRMQIAEILAFEFSQVGLELEVYIEEFGAFINRVLETDDFDMFILGWSGQIDPDRATIRQFHSGAPGTSNFPNYSNPRVDELLDDATVTDPTSERSIELYREIQQIVVEESPYAFINYDEETALYHPSIGGWSVHPYLPATFQNAHLITKDR
jgi:peptide/nickel transport system substrate-binding protein